MSELLDAVLPEYQFSELHRLSVDASPEKALAAMRDVRRRAEASRGCA